MFGRVDPDKCWLCGKPGADTDDHILSRQFWRGESLSDRPLILRAHRDCNNYFSEAEERVREDLVAIEGIKGSAIPYVREAVVRSAMTSSGKRARILKSAKRVFLVPTSSNNPELEAAWKLFVMKLVLAVAYARGRPLRQELTWSIIRNWWKSQPRNLTRVYEISGIFTMDSLLEDSDPLCGQHILTFYDYYRVTPVQISILGILNLDSIGMKVVWFLAD